MCVNTYVNIRETEGQKQRKTDRLSKRQRSPIS